MPSVNYHPLCQMACFSIEAACAETQWRVTDFLHLFYLSFALMCAPALYRSQRLEFGVMPWCPTKYLSEHSVISLRQVALAISI